MTKPRLSDPGGEIADAPIGTEDWAKRWRLDMRYIRHNVAAEPGRFRRFYDLGNQHRVWALLNKPDGSRFRDFDEFCSAREPWGLSASPEEVRGWLAVAMGPKAARQATVSEPETHAGPGRGHKLPISNEKKTKAHREPSFSPATDKRLRAINRAPDSVRKLYEQDKLSQLWAAKLGPKNPSPAQAAKVAEIAQALKGVPDRKTSDGIVRRMLNSRAPSRHDRILAIALKMPPEECERTARAMLKLSRSRKR